MYDATIITFFIQFLFILLSNVHLQNKFIVHLHTSYLFHLLHFLELSPHSIYTVNVFKAIH